MACIAAVMSKIFIFAIDIFIKWCSAVNLQQPSISHSAPDGQFVVGSQGPVITRGHSFTIICSTESQYPGGSFHLFRGSNITRISVSSRSFRSSASELLLITITASQLPVIGAAVSAVLLLLSVLIIILLLKRRQKQRNKETHSKCAFTKAFQLPVIGTAVSAVLLLLSVLIVILLPKQRNRGTHVNCSFTKGKLQMPTLSLTSTHAVVSRGENIQFSCTTPKPRCNVNAEFQLFRNGPSGSYSCQYSYQNNIKSPLSNTVNIIVVDLQQPSIFHSAPDGQFVVGSQGPVITRGHSFTIICFTESQYPGGSFHLFRGSNITRMDLQQPSISHSAPDGQFVVGSQRPVITRGHSFTIICSTESQYPGGSFHLLRGSNITRSESAVNHSSSFFFPEADYSHEGTYSCVYEVSVSSRSFRSSASELLLITITASLLPVIGAAVSAVLLLLSVLIIILLLKRRQKQRNKETHSKCSFTKGASHDENEDDDEAIYENVEFGENMDHDDSERDYINVDSDKSEQDYINVDSDQSEQNYIDVDSDQSEQDYIDVDCNYSEENYVNVDITE
ncbi:deleted in malignant brain tumors 1 -like protein [Labeo rohita]|uniref:Deleted in malignant brain tumors 1-like protein n=1 Tax=Labeo rohita TaxID=84645 RepID=A0A498LSG7_LABRO|nr:deleted in malignant brain tumors 1 -like protein [Labeo rohita]